MIAADLIDDIEFELRVLHGLDALWDDDDAVALWLACGRLLDRVNTLRAAVTTS